MKLKKCLLSVSMTIFALSSLHAQNIPDGVYYIVTNGDFAITNSGNLKANSNNAIVSRYNGNDWQKWRVENRNGKIMLHALNYDRFVIDNEGFNTVHGNNISIFPDNNTENQLWIPEKKSDGWILRSSQNPDYILGVGGVEKYNTKNVQLCKFSDSPYGGNAVWKFERAKMPLNYYLNDIRDGVYYFYPKPSRNFRLDNDDNRGVNGNNIQLWQPYDNNAQKWRVENRRGGIVIHSMNNERLVVDHEDFSTYNANNVSIFQDNGTSNQLWIPEKVGENMYVLRSSQNPNYVLDWGGALRNGGNVHLWEYLPGLNNQIWVLEPVYR